jgi:tetratricopeptide (TPR) repeat protein
MNYIATLGFAYFRAGETLKASEQSETAIKLNESPPFSLDKTNGLVWARLANIRSTIPLELGEREWCSQLAIKLSPNVAQSWISRERILKQLSRNEEASQARSKAIELLELGANRSVTKQVPYVEKYFFPGGFFAKLSSSEGTEWLELKFDNFEEFQFKEINRDGNWIQLFDSSRELLLRLPVDGGTCSWSEDGGKTWHNLYHVRRGP